MSDITPEIIASHGLSESEYTANTLPVPLACEQARGTGTRGSDPSVRGW